MAGLFDGYTDNNDMTRVGTQKKLKKKKKKAKKTTSKDMPGNGMAKKAAKDIESSYKRRKAILDAL